MSVGYQIDRGVAVISLDNAPVNAFSVAEMERLVDILQRLDRDGTCDAAVLTGAGGVFSAGIDVSLLPGADQQRIERLIGAVNDLTCAAYAFSKPLVAAVTGHAVGLGAVLLATCDYRVAAQGEYRIGLNELDAGIPFPCCAATVVQRELSAQAQRVLCLGSALYPVNAKQVCELVDELVPADRLMERAIGYAADRGNRAIFSEVKQQLRGSTLQQLSLLQEAGDPLLAKTEQLIAAFNK